MEDLISVIVPVYNVENLLAKCIESIMNQTYKNIEIILVNDGSTDSCLEICEVYKKVDSRISVYTKENGGLSSARNFGFKNSLGKYIVYIDSDDFVKETYLENLYKAITLTKADIAVSSFYLADEKGNLLGKKHFETQSIVIYDVRDALKELLLQKSFDSSAWAKIYKRHYFEYLKYPEGKLFEDLPVTYKIFLNSKKIAYINTFDYFYVQRSDSIINMKFNPQKMDLLLFVENMFDDIQTETPELLNYAGTRAFSALIALWRTIPMNSVYNKVVWDSARRYRRYPLRLRESKFKLKMGAIIAVFGRKIAYKFMSK